MSPVTRYTRTAMVFHWLLAFLILGMLALGWSFDFFPPGTVRRALQDTHKLIGCCILALALARLVWRLTHRPPEAPSVSRWQAFVAGLVHAALYGFMLLMPATGILFTNYGRGVSMFGWHAPQFGDAPNDDYQAFFQRIHDFAPYVLISLLVLHIAAALWHQFVIKDRTINRMLPD
jgi:cytochrome b561